MNSYSNYVIIDQPQEDVFNAITNKINKWWTEKSNVADKAGEILKSSLRKEPLGKWR